MGLTTRGTRLQAITMLAMYSHPGRRTTRKSAADRFTGAGHDGAHASTRDFVKVSRIIKVGQQNPA